MARTTPVIGIVGLGFVGLTAGLGFAERGLKVLGFDVATGRATQIAAGKVPFHEPGLPEALARHNGHGFRLVSTLAELVGECDVIFLCVGTPQDADGRADLQMLLQAVRETAQAMVQGQRRLTIVVKSSVPPGTAQKQIVPELKRLGLNPGHEIGFANNPEFLREGLAWDDFLKPDRIVIGSDDEMSGEAVAAAYASFGAEILRVSLTTAEFIKSVSNAFLATLISFANECSMIADSIGGVDIRTAFQALHRDRRWFGTPAGMSTYFYPGCGFGGYCLPKDSAAFASVAEDNGYQPQITRGVIQVNRAIREHFVSKIVAATQPHSRIGLLGLSFKPGSDDVRDSPASTFVPRLQQSDRHNLVGYDPIATDAFRQTFNFSLDYAPSLEEIARQSDLLVILVAWPEFRIHQALYAGKPIIDGRYFL
jgi:UDPglucose 6-dehydrogenase